MILELKQTTATYPVYYDIINLSAPHGAERFGFASGKLDGQKRATKANLDRHSFTLYEMKRGRGSKYGVRTPREKVAEIHTDISIPSYTSNPARCSLYGRYAILWRQKIYTAHEVPIRGDGLYYAIKNEAGETVSVIERSVKVANGLSCYIATIANDENVAMVSMMMLFLDAISTELTETGVLVSSYSIGMPESLPEVVRSQLDKSFIDSIVSRDMRHGNG